MWASGKEPVPDGEAPNPGAFGMLGLHPVNPSRPSTAYWKVSVPALPTTAPARRPARLRLRVSSTPGASPKADGLLRIGAFDGKLTWIASEVVGPDAAPDPKNWRWVEVDLTGYEGNEILILIQAASGGRTSWHWEAIWIDEMEIKAAR